MAQNCQQIYGAYFRQNSETLVHENFRERLINYEKWAWHSTKSSSLCSQKFKHVQTG